MLLRATRLVLTLGALCLADARTIERRGKLNMIPKYPYDPDTIKTCVWWLDNDGTWTCPEVQETFGLSMVDFGRWNPTVAMPCDLLTRERSFCIAATDARQAIQTVTLEVPAANVTTVTVTAGPLWRNTTAVSTVTVKVTASNTTSVTVPVTVPITVPVTVPIPVTVPVPVTSIQVTTSVEVSTTTVTTTVLSAPTPRRGDNGLTTPVPYQPGMVNNCKTFYFVQEGETCDKIAAKFRIEERQIVEWNPEANVDCTHLLANSYCCVGTL